MAEEDQAITARKEKVEHKLQQRNQTRECQVEAARSARSTAGQESTEDMVVQFYKEMEPLVEELEKMVTQASILPAEEVTSHLDQMVVKLQKLQEFVTESGMFLPTYDIKKTQQTLSSLNTQFQAVQEKVKPKKKFGFKSRKQKTGQTTATVPDPGTVSVVGNGAAGYSSSNSCSLSNLTSQVVVLTREQVMARDVSLEHLTDCRVEIHGPPSTLHMSTMTNCTILSGPVSTSVMVDGCTSSTLSFSCQQLRIHRTTNTDIYLHTTARAIIEDSQGVRVAPYCWTYTGLEEDYVTAGLDREVNHWDDIGDFNWLALDKHSPNWSVLPAGERREEWAADN
eukprot:GFUD01041050.1.p1 GENE.GFUD01041050.1~~GFUD01041050.1.p1  ORF type:complete len:358 (-),score=153.51 GFUD01041050.1:320-1336(-)